MAEQQRVDDASAEQYQNNIRKSAALIGTNVNAEIADDKTSANANDTTEKDEMNEENEVKRNTKEDDLSKTEDISAAKLTAIREYLAQSKIVKVLLFLSYNRLFI